MNWIIVNIFLCVQPFLFGSSPKKKNRPQKNSFLWGKKKHIFIYFLAELDHSKTLFFSKKNIQKYHPGYIFSWFLVFLPVRVEKSERLSKGKRSGSKSWTSKWQV